MLQVVGDTDEVADQLVSSRLRLLWCLDELLVILCRVGGCKSHPADVGTVPPVLENLGKGELMLTEASLRCLRTFRRIGILEWAVLF